MSIILRKILNESAELSMAEAKKIANAAFAQNKNTIFESAKEKYPDIKKSDLKISIVQIESPNQIYFSVDIGEEDGWYDVYVDIDKWNYFLKSGKKYYIDGVDWTFND